MKVYFGFVNIQYPVIKETEKAICFNIYNGFLLKEKLVWIPKSQMIIDDYGDSGKRYHIKEWLIKNFK